MSNGKLKCWGSNSYGQLGIGNEDNQSTPMYLDALDDVELVSMNADHSHAVLGSGEVYSWGSNDVGQLGLGPGDTENHNLPTGPITDLTDSSMLTFRRRG